jgi:hypothetical protein
MDPNDAEEASQPFLTTRAAAAFCGFKTTGALRKTQGWLTIASRLPDADAVLTPRRQA